MSTETFAANIERGLAGTGRYYDTLREQIVRLVAGLAGGVYKDTARNLNDSELAAVLVTHGWTSWYSVLRTLS